MRGELAGAIAAVAAQQERAVRAEARVDDELIGLRRLIAEPTDLAVLRAKHDDLTLARQRASHEAQMVDRLESVADERRAELVQASQDHQALVRLRRSAHTRHVADVARVEAGALDELALRRARRRADGRVA